MEWFSYTHMHILCHILFLYGLLQNTEYSSLCYSGGPCLSILYIYMIYITIYHNLPLVIYFACMLLTVLDTSCGWNHTVFVFLWLAVFAQHSVLEAHLCCSMWQDLLFRGFMVFHSWDDPLFLYPFIWLLPVYSWAHFGKPLSARSLCEDSCLLGLCPSPVEEGSNLYMSATDVILSFLVATL